MFGQYVLVPSAAGPGGGANLQAAEAAQAWEAVKNTPSIEVIDEFLRQYGHVPVYGALARTRRGELAKVAVVTLQPPPGRDSPLTTAQERSLKPKDTFQECENCPEMVVLPAGSFTMGSPDIEKDRLSSEGPQHVVTIRKPFAVGKLHVTVDQFATFVRETGYEAASTCNTHEDDEKQRPSRSWRNPGFAQDGLHPVVCVTWDDANAYINWLSKKSRKPYRLLSEAEFEYAARGRTSPGTYPRFWFGDNENDLCHYGNGADRSLGNGAPCNDGYVHTSPAGHYEPNAFGLYDIFGNAYQWTSDCDHSDYKGAPVDGAAWTTKCIFDYFYVTRGSSWGGMPGSLRSAWRWAYGGRFAFDMVGFRVARTLTP
jgi:formylglycine-generating enzyme required for sulfatase activity